MTLEQATCEASEAVAAGNFEQLHRALEARAAAIAGIPVTRESVPRLKAALEAGEAIARDLRLLKLKLGIDANRLAQIRAALTTGLGASRHPSISCRG